MISQASIVDLPPEILEFFFQKISATKDVGNCSIALVGTRHEKFVMENFLKPQLKKFASFNVKLNKSLRNEEWFEECQDTKLIVRLWKKFASFNVKLNKSLRNEEWFEECQGTKLIVRLWKEFVSLKGKYLVVSQKGHEIVDLLNPNSKYELLADNVPRVSHATGGLLQISPVVCGGDNEMDNTTNDCIVIGQPEMKMIEKRQDAASVALDESTLWIVGGFGNNGNNDLRSTEFIKLDQPSAKGPDLPFTIRCYSMIQYDEQSIYIIGGYQNYSCSRNTWIVDPTKGFQIKEGPSLNKKRYNHGCAKMTFDGRTILVVAGGLGEDSETLDSVEILAPSGNNVWIPGL